jgi:hypothetical protein
MRETSKASKILEGSIFSVQLRRRTPKAAAADDFPEALSRFESFSSFGTRRIKMTSTSPPAIEVVGVRLILEKRFHSRGSALF